MNIARMREHEGGTPFTNWVRVQPGLESNTKVGYVGTDVDLVWYNYKLAKIMLLEEKQHMGKVRESQEATQSVLHQALIFAFSHPDLKFYSLRASKPIPPRITYCGYHLIQFQHTSPEDGAIFIDNVQVSKQRFIEFLQFKWTPIIQCYLEQQEWIRSAYSLLGLEEAAKRIKQSVDSTHPEVKQLRHLWKIKKLELERKETMFTDEDEDEDVEDDEPNLLPYDPQMVEADRILQERGQQLG